ncbi:alpha-1,2-fucosyltransferase [Candidatus Saccharibacteria bacterium]|nr:alpha-1,2-fucosyltransferase [Candidatus Saccharibacteria bacterium]
MYLMKNMQGRLGNQLFQYAFMRAVQETYAPDAKIVLSFRRKLHEKHSPPKKDCLLFFRTNHRRLTRLPLTSSQKILIFMLSAILFIDKKLHSKNNVKRCYEIEERWQPILLKHNILWCLNGYRKFDFSKIDWTKNVVFYGYFESPKYFNDARVLEILRNEFMPNCVERIKELPIYQKLKNSNSVCLHVRRGDFVGHPRHDVCSINYYQKAINTIIRADKLQKRLGRIMPPHSPYHTPLQFAVFSDDSDWVRKNLKLPQDTIFVDDIEWDFIVQYIMRACRNFIMSNSTFSWWAQFLSEHHDNKGMVIAPVNWWNDDKHQDIYLNRWHLINNN